MAAPTTPKRASELAKQLTGQWANLKPDNPEIFIASVAAVVAQYPLGLVEECADPRRGMVRHVKFFGIDVLVEWCDKRLEFHQSLAGYVRKDKPDENSVRKARMGILVAIRGILRTIKAGGNVKALTYDQAVKLGTEATEA